MTVLQKCKSKGFYPPKGKVFPKFRSLDEMVDFVETHDLSDYLEQMPEEHFKVDLRTRKYVFTRLMDNE